MAEDYKLSKKKNLSEKTKGAEAHREGGAEDAGSFLLVLGEPFIALVV